MTELPHLTPELIESVIRASADAVQHHIDIALAPIEARLDELERRIAEMSARLDDIPEADR